MTLQQDIFFRYLIQVFRQIGLYIHHRTHLKQIERTRLFLWVQRYGKFNFYRTTHFALSVFLCQLKYTGQREHFMLKNIGKSDYLTATRINTIADDHIIRIVSGSDKLQSSILFRFLHWKFQQIESIVQREVLTMILQVKRIERSLCFAKGYFHFAGLQDLCRMIRTYPKSQSAIYDVLTQAQCQTYGTFLCLFIAYRIVVQRTGHP